jgi:hypothetical protein
LPSLEELNVADITDACALWQYFCKYSRKQKRKENEDFDVPLENITMKGNFDSLKTNKQCTIKWCKVSVGMIMCNVEIDKI